MRGTSALDPNEEPDDTRGPVETPRPAGSFGTWLGEMRAVLRGHRDADVPCDGCVGCCVSAYPIPLRPDDVVALDQVPAALLALPVGEGLARMLPRGDGTCPMLSAGRCDIYPDRPRTCRDYDCRIYAAAGLQPDGDRPVIQQRVKAWRFELAGQVDREGAQAVARAAAFIRTHAELFPAATRAHSATAAAVLAVKVYALFLQPRDRQPGVMVREILDAARDFDAGIECRAAVDPG